MPAAATYLRRRAMVDYESPQMGQIVLLCNLETEWRMTSHGNVINGHSSRHLASSLSPESLVQQRMTDWRDLN